MSMSTGEKIAFYRAWVRFFEAHVENWRTLQKFEFPTAEATLQHRASCEEGIEMLVVELRKLKDQIEKLNRQLSLH